MKLQEEEIIERRDLIDLPEVKEQRPPVIGYCMASMFCQYKGTDCFQWWANTIAGRWTPYGEVIIGISLASKEKVESSQ